jgi:hypothetical protein
MIKLVRAIVRLVWILNGYFSRTLTLDTPLRVTVLLTYYNPARMSHIGPRVRNILKCSFVEKVVVSNHNPAIRIADRVNFKDARLICMDQAVPRGCGYRWQIARALSAQYLVAIDDDIMLFPSQLQVLFQHLIQAPEVPHGLSGMLPLENGKLKYRQWSNMEVPYLCEVYAVTREQVDRYFELERRIVASDETLLDVVERVADFVVISQTGAHNPRIHRAWWLLRDDTFETRGIAISKDERFWANVVQVVRTIEKLRSEESTRPSNPTPEPVPA